MVRCNGKYYIHISGGVMVQVSEQEHERIRNLRNEPLIEYLEPIDEYIWIDDPTYSHRWPEWLPDGWVAIDRDGPIYWYEQRPACREDFAFWEPEEGDWAELTPFVDRRCLTLPPLNEDWRKNIWGIKHEKKMH